MISIRRYSPVPTAVVAFVIAAVLTGCGSGDANATSNGNAKSGAAATTTTVPSQLKFSSTPSSEWGALAKCPIPPQSAAPGGTPAHDGIDGVLEFGTQSRDHVERCVDYPVNPAVGGDHFPVWANCGFYTSPVPEEAAVHVLEHGGVWIAFDPNLDASSIATIRKATDATTHILASPYPGLTSKVVLSAWSRQLSLDSTSDPRFNKFIDKYLQGPDTPELGAACSGGLGKPEPK